MAEPIFSGGAGGSAASGSSVKKPYEKPRLEKISDPQARLLENEARMRSREEIICEMRDSILKLKGFDKEESLNEAKKGKRDWILKAIDIAEKGLAGKKRFDLEDEFLHALRMANILAMQGAASGLIVAALLHPMHPEMDKIDPLLRIIPPEWSNWIRKTIENLNKPYRHEERWITSDNWKTYKRHRKKIPGAINRVEQNERHAKQVMDAWNNGLQAPLTIMLSNCLDNLQHMGKLCDEKKRQVVAEALPYIWASRRVSAKLYGELATIIRDNLLIFSEGEPERQKMEKFISLSTLSQESQPFVLRGPRRALEFEQMPDANCPLPILYFDEKGPMKHVEVKLSQFPGLKPSDIRKELVKAFSERFGMDPGLKIMRVGSGMRLPSWDRETCVFRIFDDCPYNDLPAYARALGRFGTELNKMAGKETIPCEIKNNLSDNYAALQGRRSVVSLEPPQKSPLAQLSFTRTAFEDSVALVKFRVKKPGSPKPDYTSIFGEICSNLKGVSEEDIKFVRKAFDLCIARSSEPRISGAFGPDHPILVADAVSEATGDPLAVVLALLHDGGEDGWLSPGDVRKMFGSWDRAGENAELLVTCLNYLTKPQHGEFGPITWASWAEFSRLQKAERQRKDERKKFYRMLRTREKEGPEFSEDEKRKNEETLRRHEQEDAESAKFYCEVYLPRVFNAPLEILHLIAPVKALDGWQNFLTAANLTEAERKKRLEKYTRIAELAKVVHTDLFLDMMKGVETMLEGSWDEQNEHDRRILSEVRTRLMATAAMTEMNHELRRFCVLPDHSKLNYDVLTQMPPAWSAKPLIYRTNGLASAQLEVPLNLRRADDEVVFFASPEEARQRLFEVLSSMDGYRENYEFVHKKEFTLDAITLVPRVLPAGWRSAVIFDFHWSDALGALKLQDVARGIYNSISAQNLDRHGSIVAGMFNRVDSDLAA